MITITDKGAEKINEFLAQQESKEDTAGLRVLLCSGEAFEAHDQAWFIVGASSAVWRVIELTDTRSQLPLVAPPSSRRSAPPKAAPQRLAG